jgi:hypothetical protein
MARLAFVVAAGCALLRAQGGDAEKLAPYYPTPETIVRSPLDVCSSIGSAPNKVRDFTSVPAQNPAGGEAGEGGWPGSVTPPILLLPPPNC